MKIVKISASNPDLHVIKEAAAVIKRGGLVIFPTETVYGLGAEAFNVRAVRKIFKAKGRPEGKPLIVHVAKKSVLAMLALNVPAVARKLVGKFWPGPLTLVLQAKKNVPRLVAGISDKSAILGTMALLSENGVAYKESKVVTVAMRMPDHPVALALIRVAGPLAASSANFSGEKPPTSVSQIPRVLLAHVDLVLDAGPTTVQVPSTVLDLTQSAPMILRPGAISQSQIEKLIKQKLRD